MAIHEQTNDDQVRAQVHGMWAAVADRWRDHADDGDARLDAVTRAMLARTAPEPGDRVLELACGPGGTGLAAAPLVGPNGQVVLSDVAPEMTAIAADRAAARGFDHVTTAVLDLEAIDRPDGCVDVVLCREGLMFALDPERATREIHRVLAPGGRVAASVWASKEANPWLGVVFDAVSAVTGFPVPPPGVPGPFSLGDPARLESLLTAAGFDEVGVESIPVPLVSPSFDAWWARTTALAGPLALILARLSDEALDAITRRLRTAVEPYASGSGFELPGVVLLTSGRR